MGKKCFVPRCNTGYKSCKEKLSLFSAPKDFERLEKWRRAIPRKDRVLQTTDFVCERHFEPELVSKEWTAEYEGHVLMNVPRRAILCKDAVPTKFPDCPAYLSKTPKSRKRPAERTLPAPSKKRASLTQPCCEVNASSSSPSDGRSACAAPTSGDSAATDVRVPCEEQLCAGSSIGESSVFARLLDDIPISFFPSKSWGVHRLELGDLKSVVFSELRLMKKHSSDVPSETASELTPFSAPKIVQIDEKMQVHTIFMGKRVPVEQLNYANQLTTLEDVKSFLQFVDKIKICPGGPSILQYPQVQPESAYIDISHKWRHKSCSLVISSEASCCQRCLSLPVTLHIRQKRMTERKRRSQVARFRLPSFTNQRDKDAVATLRRANYALRRSKNRLLNRFKHLSAEIRKAREQLKKMSDEDIETKLKNVDLPGAHLTVVRECLAAARLANKKGRRYTEQWLLMCLLLHIRSPSAYSFLRENDILPLPCLTTVRKYLSTVRVKCGFDARFFTAFKKKMTCKDTFQRHGILVFDEIQVRKEMRVHSKSMTYCGFSDFGDGVATSDDLADHGLVFTFRAFGDNYSQPVAVFASKGPTKGVILAQLVLKAIYLLEEAGALVDAIVCDGAATNRLMWKELGISGALHKTSNSFVHPLDDARKVFVFSDAPHLVKCVRNRLYAQKVLCVNGERVQWAHYDRLFVEDSKQPGHLRVCPKITHSHINPSNTEKMRVRLATQLFSRSVAQGLDFYSKRGTQGLHNVKGTIEFTLKFNDVFDAMNRSTPQQGVTAGSKDMRILASFLHWLNTWEKNVVAGKISRANYLTEQTAEGLRVTVLSTLELSRYLLKECGFKYVLTAKFNQDVLERFFGIIRQVGGQNEHPSMPTFLQLYNMLSVYSLIKPPKFGNCELEATQGKPVLTLADVKLAFQKDDQDQTHMQRLKEKLDGLVAAEVEIDEVFDHVYEIPGTVDCIIYYLAGFMCRKLLKITSCSTCQENLVESTPVHLQPQSALVECKSRGGLLHPKRNIFLLLRAAEEEFQRHATDRHVYELMLENMLEQHSFSFPCQEHKEEVMAHLLHNFIAMRMRQVCKQKKLEMKNKTQELRKLAKIV